MADCIKSKAIHLVRIEAINIGRQVKKEGINAIKLVSLTIDNTSLHHK